MESKPSPTEFFSKHAAHYATSEGHAHGSDLARLRELLGPKPSDTVLDVATGTGFTALEMAPYVKSVVGVDITEEMLAEARKLARERGITNARFENADALRLPYEDASFDIVTCRRASHHFADIDRFLSESRRVLRAGRRLGVDDMSPPEGAQDFFNSIEILRDDTHVGALTLSDWRFKMAKAGLEVEHAEIMPEPQTFERWLSPLKLGGKEDMAIEQAIRDWPKPILEALEVRQSSGRVEGLTKHRLIIIARK